MSSIFEQQDKTHQKMVEYIEKDSSTEITPLRKWMIEKDLNYAKICPKSELHKMSEYISALFEQHEGDKEMTDIISEMEEHSINLLQMRY